ncbi:MAG TPA: MFS transporter [Candidatus Methylomirabilis sp.]|jgi:MFS family permease
MAGASPPRPPAPGPAPPGARPRLFTAPFVLTCLAAFTFFLSHQMVLVAVPLYAMDRGGSETDAGILTLLFTVAAFTGRVPVGWAMDRWGRRPIMMAGTAVAAVSGLVYPAVQTVPALFALRFFHGLAMALFSTAAAVVVTDVVPPVRRGEGLGFFGMGSNTALALGPLLSLAVVSRLSFSPLFLASAGVALAGVALGATVGETGVPAQVRFSFRPGTAFVRAAIFPAIIMGTLTVAHGSVVTFLPIMGRVRAVGNPGAFFTMAAILLVAVRAKAGSLSDRWGRGPVIVPGMFLTAAAMVVVGLAHAPATLLAAGALYGLGLGLAQPALMALVADRVGERERGRAIATFYTGWELGIGLGAYTFGYLLTWTDFTVTYWAAGLVTAAGCLGYLLASGRRRRQGPEGSAR